MCPASAPLEYLEYDEQEEDDDDLFGEQEDSRPASGPSSIPAFNTSRPLGANKADSLITGPSSSSSRKGKERAPAKDPQDRLDELRFMRLPKPVQGRTGRGAMSLRDIAMSGTCLAPVRCGLGVDMLVVIKQNSTRIWDIGDLEYRVIADFLHELPMEQLAEIEGMSPVGTASSHHMGLTRSAHPKRYRLALGVLSAQGLSDLLRSVQGERWRDAIVRLEKDVQGKPLPSMASHKRVRDSSSSRYRKPWKTPRTERRLLQIGCSNDTRSWKRPNNLERLWWSTN